MTSRQLLEWYNHERPQLSRTNSKGAQHGSTMQGISSVLRCSILFDAPFETLEGAKIWGARPLSDVVEKAIASKRQLKKFPHFLQKAITEKLQEESE
jgi:hypothetical protein